jgi:hypothetical protein
MKGLEDSAHVFVTKSEYRKAIEISQIDFKIVMTFFTHAVLGILILFISATMVTLFYLALIFKKPLQRMISLVYGNRLIEFNVLDYKIIDRSRRND